MIGVYFESWACPWSASGQDLLLTRLDKSIDIVYLSFVKPFCMYNKGQNSFQGTGLDFCVPFNHVKESIAILKQRGVKVLLAVGGATYAFNSYNVDSVVDLMNDLGCDGIDIDWEPINGIQSAAQLGPIINRTRNALPYKLVTLAGFSTGCFPANGDTYRGMCIPGLKTNGHQLDMINIMAYDAGKGFDVNACYDSYRQYFSKILLVGLQVGKQGWGDAWLTLQDVDNTCKYITSKKNQDGVFVWAYFKQGPPSATEVCQRAGTLLTPSTVPIPGQNVTKIKCPKCTASWTLTLTSD